MGTLCDRKVDSNLASVHFNAVTSLFSRSRVSLLLEVDECESAGTTSLSVINDLHVFDVTVFAQYVFQVTFLCVDTQTKDTQTSTRLWIFPITTLTVTGPRSGPTVVLTTAAVSTITPVLISSSFTTAVDMEKGETGESGDMHDATRTTETWDASGA